MRTIVKITILLLILLLSKNYEVKSQVNQQDSLALVALYHCTGGPGWVTDSNWLAGPVNTWWGITVSNVDAEYRVTEIALDHDRYEGNNLIGTLPTEMGNLTALKSVFLRGNLIHNDIPKEFFVPSLENVNIENSRFTGRVPDEMKKCINMTNYRMNNNYFTYIPVIPKAYAPDLYIRLYRNFLTHENQEEHIDYALANGGPWAGFAHKEMFGKLREEGSPDYTVEIIAKLGETVILESDDKAIHNDYSEGWLKNGFNTYVGTESFTINNLTENDYGIYQFKVRNQYIDDNSNADNANYTSHYYYITPAPVPHFVSAATSSDGMEIEVVFDIPMSNPGTFGSEFIIRANGAQNIVTGSKLKEGASNTIILTLTSAITSTHEVTIQYAKQYVTGNILSADGVKLINFYARKVVNTVPEAAPMELIAQATSDGDRIRIYFDKDMADPASYFSDFTVYSGLENPVTAANLNNSDPKIIELTLTEPLLTENRGVVKYTGSSILSVENGMLASFLAMPIKTPMLVDSAKTNQLGDKVYLICNKPIIKSNIFNGFEVYQNGTKATIHSIERSKDSDSVLVINLSDGISPDSSVTVNFFPGKIHATDGSVLEEFSALSVKNNTSLKAFILSAKFINPDRIEVTFHMPLDTSTIDGSPDGFLIVSGGDTMDIQRLYAITDSTYTLYIELEDPVYSDVSTIINYYGGGIRTIRGNLIADFENFEVEAGINPIVTFIVDMRDYNQYYPGQIDTAVFLMGINNDWEKGIAMYDFNNDSLFAVTIDTFAYGKTIEYTFRNNTVWEYSGMQTRVDTLTASIDTIYALFGEENMVNVNKITTIDETLDIYPNPATNEINITTKLAIDKVVLSNILGQTIHSIELSGKKHVIDISYLHNGIYLISAYFENGNIITRRVIKK